MVQYLIPRQENIVGGDFSGSDGDGGRTYTLAHEGVNPSGVFSIIKQGAPLMYSHDFTVSGQVLTIAVPVYNDEVISIQYYTTDTAAAVASPAGTDKQDIIRRKLSRKVFNVIGKSVILKSTTPTTYNSRGELEVSSIVSSTITIVPYNHITRQSYERFGDLKPGELEAAVPYNVTININDVVTMEGEDWKIMDVQPNWLPDNVVTLVRMSKVLA